MLKFHVINSSSNLIFKDLKLFVKNGVNKNYNELFCVAGFKNNLVALQNKIQPHTIFFSSDINNKDFNQLKVLTKNWKIRWIQLHSKLVDKLNDFGMGNDIFIYYPKTIFTKQSFILNNNFNYVLCDHIQHPDNLGSIIRNAAAFNIKGIFLWNCASIYSVKVIRSSAGNVFNVFISIINKIDELIEALKSKNIQLVGLENTSKSEHFVDVIFRKKNGNLFILGNEGHGISNFLLNSLDVSCKIPINEKVDSLNVAATSAILFHELSK